MKMILPPSTLENISPPDKKNYTYFQFLDTKPFRPAETTYNLANAWRLSELALLAYADKEFILKAGKPLIAGGYELAFRKQGTTEYIIASDKQTIVLVFRGTEIDNFWGSVCDWITDFKFRLKRDKHGSRIHHGFTETLDQAWKSIVDEIRPLQARLGKPVWITGHSLGAALATVAAYRATVDSDFNVAALYTFGSPLVGDQGFKDKFITTGLAKRTYRVRNHNDIVTRVPPFPEYAHVGDLKLIDNAGHLHELAQEPEAGAFGNVVTALADSLEFARHFGSGAAANPTVPGFIADHAPTYYSMHLYNNFPDV